ncbi:MAG: phosphatase PAP2 family protein [Ignavibacteriota bacterium]
MRNLLFMAILLFAASSFAQEQERDSATDAQAHGPDSSRIIGHVYHVNFWKSIAVTLGTELAILAVNTVPNHTAPEITDAEFNTLQSPTGKDQLNAIDRLSLKLGKPSVDYTWIAVDFQTLCAAAPLTLLFGEKYRKNWDDIVLMMAEMNAINMFTFQFSPFGPFFQRRYRPITYYAITPEERQKEKVGNNRASFYSGHTSAATASLYFMAKIYCDYNPQIRGWDKIGIFALASVPPMIMGYLRVIALRHFISDVLVGGIVGGTIGILVPELHRIAGKDFSLGAYSSPEGTGLTFAMKLR